MNWSTLVSGWNLMRGIRLILGVFILIEGVNSQQWIPGIVGGIFLLQALLNVGCCASSGCDIPKSTSNTNNAERVQYEEIKSK